MNEEQKVFENRISNKINQRILKIEKIEKNELGEIIELIVTVERNDEVMIDPEDPEKDNTGTLLDANALNEIVLAMIREIKQEEDELES